MRLWLPSRCRIENPTVARDRLHSMSQDREENVRARLRGQAATCQYSKQCTCGLIVDYTEENVADALITGLADQDIKQGILGEPNQPLTIERAMAYVESKEVSISQLDPNNAQVQETQGQPLPDVDDSRCYFCGKTGHGKYPALSTECKAQVQQLWHSETVCKSKPPPRPVTENASASTHGANKHHTLDHHIFNSKAKQWEKRQSLPQPTRLPDDYIKLRLPRGAVINIDGMLDARAVWSGLTSSRNWESPKLT